jgi:hypothetical protein
MFPSALLNVLYLASVLPAGVVMLGAAKIQYPQYNGQDLELPVQLSSGLRFGYKGHHQ